METLIPLLPFSPSSLLPCSPSSALLLDRHDAAIKLRQAETCKGFVVAPSLVAKNADRDLLSQLERLRPIRAPVHSGEVAAKSNVCGQLVEFTTYSEIAGVGAQVCDQA